MKNIGVLAFARFLKLLANTTKVAAYGFHYLFPDKRFIIPERAPPLWRSRRSSRIPRTLWQTNFTNRATLPVYLNYLCNRLLAPCYEYRFLITEDRASFIEANFSPEIFAAYSRLQVGAAQADYWRVLVLHKRGGVYLDIDAHVVWPLDRIVKPAFDELFIATKRGEISNYFIASAPNNPHLQRVAEAIRENIEDDSEKNIFELTGPGVFNKVLSRDAVRTRLYRYTCNQGNFTNEHFQYIDKPEGKWTRQQQQIDVVRKLEPGE
ncbi:glycosyltransferase family 32 protein [Halomonas chromatireducens]|uniref:Glycosyltransferase sugar-binding region containing DXD motif protein n=1 Tax=Halomonas chromatireducens TaxID=507626 RepID=A0A109UN46_9GAMM|nr:glycosyltransferase [Halomonas chromatireducens]AMD02374.1 Glycosyltransferase sugar-binding region containing DXD motif protein [Halomonas chromatireducens]